MANYFLLPLQVGTPQQCDVTLGGNQYQLTLRYRNAQDQGGWILDIADTTGNAILSGVPLVTGCDLLAQYPHLNFGGALVVATTANADAVPTFDNLGRDCNIYWVTP